MPNEYRVTEFINGNPDSIDIETIAISTKNHNSCIEIHSSDQIELLERAIAILKALNK